MSLSFSSLGSGSRGNATLIKSANALLMVDCGFTIKEVERRLDILGHSPRDLTAMVVTHEHSDHIKGVGPLARKYDLPIYLTHGTAQHKTLGNTDKLQYITIQQGFSIADIDITPVAVPHDAREPCQFIFSCQQKTIGVLTDLGQITPHVTEHYSNCDALMLEFNHDLRMLSTGPYPYSLKQRVGGQWGHLNNQQAAYLLTQLDRERLQHLVISHISEKNNTHELVRESIGEVFDEINSLVLACQDEGFDWITVS